uniref:Uncharacterized protein n=1 Tax=Naja naja TaxID=35670 RepID=A0A8C6Y8G2_NAJNA
LTTAPPQSKKIFPFAHVSNDKKCVTLLNPQAVDLDAYRKKVQEAIKIYERRLDQIVWKALPQKEKEKFEQDRPVSYVDRKESLLEALANAKWPIASQELVMLEDEIITALTYLFQTLWDSTLEQQQLWGPALHNYRLTLPTLFGV